MAHEVGAMMVVDSDTHQPENLMDDAAAKVVALGAGLTEKEADIALHVTPFELTKKL
jgi:histidinol phosphatase-like PHP family hydrolase